MKKSFICVGGALDGQRREFQKGNEPLSFEVLVRTNPDKIAPGKGFIISTHRYRLTRWMDEKDRPFEFYVFCDDDRSIMARLIEGYRPGVAVTGAVRTAYSFDGDKNLLGVMVDSHTVRETYMSGAQFNPATLILTQPTDG